VETILSKIEAAFNLSNAITLLLDAQRHVLRGDQQGADRLIGAARTSLQPNGNKKG
jgi:hypothetical protein